MSFSPKVLNATNSHIIIKDKFGNPLNVVDLDPTNKTNKAPYGKIECLCPRTNDCPNKPISESDVKQQAMCNYGGTFQRMMGNKPWCKVGEKHFGVFSWPVYDPPCPEGSDCFLEHPYNWNDPVSQQYISKYYVGDPDGLEKLDQQSICKGCPTSYNYLLPSNTIGVSNFYDPKMEFNLTLKEGNCNYKIEKSYPIITQTSGCPPMTPISATQEDPESNYYNIGKCTYIIGKDLVPRVIGDCQNPPMMDAGNSNYRMGSCVYTIEKPPPPKITQQGGKCPIKTQITGKLDDHLIYKLGDKEDIKVLTNKNL